VVARDSDGTIARPNFFTERIKADMKIKTYLRAGEYPLQHNQTVAHALRVKTGIKSGPSDTPIIRG
jgi:hypothetical protein